MRIAEILSKFEINNFFLGCLETYTRYTIVKSVRLFIG